MVVVFQHLGQNRTASVHAEGQEELVGDKLRIGQASSACPDSPRDENPIIRVRPILSKTVVGHEEAKPIADLLSIVTEAREEIAGVGGKPGAMGEEIPQSSVAGGVRVIECQVGEILHYRRVPAQFVLVHQRSQSARGEELAEGSELETRVLVNETRLARRAHAIALEEDRPVVFDHNDHGTGNVMVAQCLVDELVEAETVAPAVQLVEAACRLRRAHAEARDEGEHDSGGILHRITPQTSWAAADPARIGPASARSAGTARPLIGEYACQLSYNGPRTHPPSVSDMCLPQFLANQFLSGPCGGSALAHLADTSYNSNSKMVFHANITRQRRAI